MGLLPIAGKRKQPRLKQSVSICRLMQKMDMYVTPHDTAMYGTSKSREIIRKDIEKISITTNFLIIVS